MSSKVWENDSLDDISSWANRTQLINAYDNTIRHTDRLLYQLIQRLDTIGCPGAMLYTSDHGEDIFDDGRLRFLHASPSPTFTQLHVPLLGAVCRGRIGGLIREKKHVAAVISVVVIEMRTVEMQHYQHFLVRDGNEHV